jgi:formamidopyrimidine-DNA glycosylase
LPELPEVENVRRSLESLVVGKTIASVDVRLPRIIRTPDDVRQFELELAGCTIRGVGRRGKYLLFDVSPYTLVSHLRMEGQYRLADTGEEEAPHTHVVFRFTDGTELRYRDVRQFGTMDLLAPGQPAPEGLATLGPEPFDPLFDATAFYRRIHRRTAPVKAVLLDQTVIAGLGNIYVDESLFRVGIHPELPANRVTKKQCAELLDAIRVVFQEAIDAGGTSIRSYVDGYGRHGGFQMELDVYGRDGKPCRTCGAEIVKLRVAGRGTHVCPVCQKRPRTPRKAGRTSGSATRSRNVGSGKTRGQNMRSAEAMLS